MRRQAGKSTNSLLSTHRVKTSAMVVNSRNTGFVFFAIVIAQFCGTSLWFAGNAVLPQLQQTYGWPSSGIAYLTSITQLGFITGTLLFSITGITDKHSPSRVF